MHVSMLERPAGAKGLNAFQDHQENSQASLGLEEWKEETWNVIDTFLKTPK